MAASPSSLTLFHNTFTYSPQQLISLQLQPFRLCHRQIAATSQLPAIFTPSTNRNERVRVRVRVRAGYRKRRMDTPGAYELVDEESGEKVIVWGGGDDDDDVDVSVLAKNVFSWNRKNQEKKATITREGVEGSEPPSTAQDYSNSTVSTPKLARGFGRLKTQKIRSLVRKASVEKQETINHKYEDVDTDEAHTGDETVTSDSKDVYIKGKRNNIAKSGIEQLLEDKRHPKSFDSNRNSTEAAQSGSTARSDRWSSGESRNSSRVEPRDLKHDRKYSPASDFFSRNFFKDLPCSNGMLESLKAQGYVRPSHIQAMAYAPAVDGKSCIIADQSGSGKTLAYLAPVIQRLRQEETEGISKSASKSPRAVVLVPTAELASQVLRNCRSISKSGVPFRSMVATGGFKQRTQLESLEQELDVLIATPGRFMYLIKEDFLQLTNLRCTILDEVDVLYNDEAFEQALQTLITSSPVTAQYLFVTATLPLDIYNKLVEVFPDCEVIMGPGMHRTSSGLEEVLVDCSGSEGSEKTPEAAFSNKKSALLKLAESSPVPKTIVFCNKIETCRKVENALRRFDRKENQVRILPFHAALEQESRLANMKEFVESDAENRSLFLICTDRASRGIDFPNVDHVVLFDFPRDPSEYVRRVGRTARGAGGTGKAFIFVVGKQVSLASRIIDRNQKGHPLHEVPSAYELVR